MIKTMITIMIIMEGLKFTITFNYHREYATYRHSSPSSMQNVCYMDLV